MEGVRGFAAEGDLTHDVVATPCFARYFRPVPYNHTMPTTPQKLRKQYVNTEYPNVVLRFEDGHEIVVKRGVGKTFDIFPGETVRVLAVFDPDARERELVMTKKAEEFENA